MEGGYTLEEMKDLVDSEGYKFIQKCLQFEIDELVKFLLREHDMVLKEPQLMSVLKEEKFDYFTLTALVIDILKKVQEEPENIMKTIILSLQTRIGRNADGSDPKVLKDAKETLHKLEKQRLHGSE